MAGAAPIPASTSPKQPAQIRIFRPRPLRTPADYQPKATKASRLNHTEPPPGRKPPADHLQNRNSSRVNEKRRHPRYRRLFVGDKSSQLSKGTIKGSKNNPVIPPA